MSAKTKIVTHNGGFHADDVFAVATLLLYLGKEADEVEIIRTRDPQLIAQGDFVVDVGGEYDSERNRFDHHQRGGAGERENGIPYASFGLVWKEYGEEVCGSSAAYELIEKRLVTFIDADDVGVSVYQATKEGVDIYTFPRAIKTLRATWKESKEDMDGGFLEAVRIGKKILMGELKHAKSVEPISQEVVKIYQEADDKALIFFPNSKGWPGDFLAGMLTRYPEILYFITQRPDENWQVIAVEKETFVPRKPFPEEWAGLRDGDLQKVTGVADAVFCHNARFMCVAKSSEGALELARKALES